MGLEGAQPIRRRAALAMPETSESLQQGCYPRAQLVKRPAAADHLGHNSQQTPSMHRVRGSYHAPYLMLTTAST